MQKVVLVAGGTGFVGQHVVDLLQKKGYRVITHSRSYKAVPTHADIIINLVGIIREERQTFKQAHVEFTKWLLGLGKKLKVQQFVQMSALGVEQQTTAYQRTKLQAEKLVQESGLPYAIIRPSMIFGKDDKSVNTFRALSRTGFFPLLANGNVQPVAVDTVAEVIVAAAEKRMRNRIVEVGGPEVLTYRQLADRIHPGVRVIKMPKFMISILTFFGEFIKKLPTHEQVIMLGQDTVTKKNIVDSLGIKNPRLK